MERKSNKINFRLSNKKDDFQCRFLFGPDQV